MSSTPQPHDAHVDGGRPEIIKPLKRAEGHPRSGIARSAPAPACDRRRIRAGLSRLRQRSKRLPLAALAGAGLMAPAGPPHAAELRPPGTFDVELGGEVAFLAPFGSLEEKVGERIGSHGFATDTSIGLAIDAEDEVTGLSYGAYLEFEAVTDLIEDADEVRVFESEAWIFVEGRFGELRFGDDDGVSENMALAGFTVATGSGGTDGDFIGTPAVNYLTNTGISTKVIYYSPEIAGFQLGVSYSPRDTDDGGLEDFLEAGLAYTGSLGEVDLLGSVVGTYGRSDAVDEDTDSEALGVMGGAVLYLAGFSVAAGLGTEKVAGVDSSWYNVGVAYEAEPVTASVNFGHCFACEQPDDPERDLDAYNLVLGVEVAVAPGLAASLEVSIFEESRFDEDNGRFDAGDSGVLGLSRLAVVF